jgi:hypothetical protein
MGCISEFFQLQNFTNCQLHLALSLGEYMVLYKQPAFVGLRPAGQQEGRQQPYT